MLEFTPDLVARVATNLYRQPPDTVPPQPVDSATIARELLSRAQEETSATAPRQGGASGGYGSLDEPDEGLSLVTQAFESIRADERVQGALSTSLGVHADNLVRQQSYRDSHVPTGSLKKFVAAVQSCPQGSCGAHGNWGVADPFVGLLGASLPAGGKLNSAPAFNVMAIRQDFPILRQQVHGRPLVWFDNAATTQKPRQVIEALTSFYANDNSNIHRGAHALAARATDAFEGARDKIKHFINADSRDEIIFVRGTTEGINLVATTYGRTFIQAGDEIILSELEHHANIVPWQLIARERGADIRVIPVNDRGEINLAEYERLLGPRTRLVALAHANNSLGTVLPIQEMTHLAKRHGAHVLIDGAQSVAHIPVDVRALGIDFFVFSGHKIFGPTGIGAVYGRKELLEVLPPWQGGGNMIKDVTFAETVYADIPARFEAGTPNVADAYGLGIALDYVNQIGLANIAAHEHRLLEYATERLQGVNGVRLIGTAREKVAVTSFILNGKTVTEVGNYLDQQGIAVRAGHHCAQPSLRRFGLEATVRPSFSLYNTIDEIDRLVEALKQFR